MSKTNLKPYLLLITYAGAVFLVVTHLDTIFRQIGWVASVAMPFIIGFVIAFVLNRPYKFFRHRLYEPAFAKIGLPERRQKSLAALLGILTVYFLLFFLLVKLVSSVVPELVSSVRTFSSNLEGYMDEINALMVTLSERFPVDTNFIETINRWWTDLLSRLDEVANTVLPAVWDASMTAANSIYNLFTGFIVSIYLLTGKDKLLLMAKKATYAFLPTRWADYLMHVAHVANRSFGGFLTGQVIDSAIVGVLCFIGMNLLKLPYAMLISLLVGVTNIIPYFGPFIGAAPGVVMLFLTEPIQALWFIILILCIQQFDGNFMSPRIVGSSIGISGVWVLFSIIVGGSLFGIPGMVAGLPTFGMIYVLVREQAHRLLKEKGRDPSDPERPYCEGESCEVEDSLTAVFGKEPPEAK